MFEVHRWGVDNTLRPTNEWSYCQTSWISRCWMIVWMVPLV